MRFDTSSLRKPTPSYLIYCDFESDTSIWNSPLSTPALQHIVTDSRYSVFRDFVSTGANRMSEYLAGVREATTAVLGNGIAAPFRLNERSSAVGVGFGIIVELCLRLSCVFQTLL